MSEGAGSGRWFAAVLAESTDGPVLPGVSAGVQCEVTGGPVPVVSHWVLADGALNEAAAGPSVGPEPPDVTVRLDGEVARALRTGALDPSVAWMQGRIRADGSMRSWIALLADTATHEFRRFRERVTEITAERDR